MESSFSPNKQIKNRKQKPYHQIHHPNHQYLAAPLSNIWRQSSCGSNITLHHHFAAPPHVQREMLHAATGNVFLNHFPSSNNNNINSSPLPILPSHHHQPPPLLPLPVVSKPTSHSLPALTRRTSLSTPVPRKHTSQINLKLSSSATQTNKKKSTSHQKITNKKENPSNDNNNGSLLAENNGAVGPDSKTDLKKEVGDDEIGKFIGASVYCVSPPPSSLPLPKFSLRPLHQNKISCKAQAAADEVDSGVATDNLCRLLKLR